VHDKYRLYKVEGTVAVAPPEAIDIHSLRVGDLLWGAFKVNLRYTWIDGVVTQVTSGRPMVATVLFQDGNVRFLNQTDLVGKVTITKEKVRTNECAYQRMTTDQFKHLDLSACIRCWPSPLAFTAGRRRRHMSSTATEATFFSFLKEPYM
jgi:hypothetical protein